jgi:hypothetical protein
MYENGRAEEALPFDYQNLFGFMINLVLGEINFRQINELSPF